MKIAIPYRRVSTQGQAENGHSMDNQDIEIPRWIAAHGYQGVSPEITDALCDNGISGKNLRNRPGAMRAIELACEYGKQAKRSERPVLIVHSLSRLARSTKELYEIAERLNKAGCDLASCTEPFDTTTIEGQLLFGVLAVVAQFERGLRSKQSKEIAKYLKTKQRQAGCIPYGLMHDPEKNRTRTRNNIEQTYHSDLIENPAEQPILTRILESAAKPGMTPGMIAQDLNKTEVPTRDGTRWTRHRIRRILETHQKS